MSQKSALTVFIAMTVVVIVAAALSPRVAQPLSYHHFADQRSWLGIPNFGDVASNAAFAVVGIWGLFFLGSAPGRDSFLDSSERWPYVFVFFGMVLTAFGSAYYHLSPDNNRLVWDRLPMTIVFMGLVSAMICERISLRAGLWLLPFLLALGVASVLQWHWSEVRSQGDLRFYAAVQVYAALVLLVSLCLPARYTLGSDLAVVVAFYALAKVLETFDKPIFSALGVASGHALKHLAAALAGFWILRMLEKRKPLPSS